MNELFRVGWRLGGAEFAIDLGDSRAVGGIAIRRDEQETGIVETVGYWIAPDARGQGLAGRALRILAPWAAEHLQLPNQQLVS